MKYTNYIFDLYGTLVDIRTDEYSKAFWKKMADYYACFGADYTAESLKENYNSLIKKEEKRLISELKKKKIDCRYPEIKLEKIFGQLLLQAPKKHSSEAGDHLLASPELDTWSVDTAHFFRITSRKHFRLYPGTLTTLKELRKQGAKIYLLSNAQRSFTFSEMEVLGLPKLFDGIYVSSDLKMKKPQPEFLLSLLKEYHLDGKESVMVGNDFQSDVGIARACHVDSVFLNTDRFPDAELKKRLKAAKQDGEGKITIFADGKITHLLDE
ncbi:MAG: HAD family hydrolase [Lachnospiraceae bacterium]|nr:HAD family hydrolase [Lachnospiraceae bacterium]